MSKTFSVLTVSKRISWEVMAFKSLQRQTVKPNKWVVVLEYEPKWHLFNIPRGFETEVLRAPGQTRLSNLNASLNEGLRNIDTDYVIFYQDYIDLPEDCFEKLLSLVDERTFVTTCTPNYDNSNDGRYTGVDLPRPCRPEEWEANVAIAPMGLLRELGGFDEEYDWGWSWDNVNVAERAAMLGAKFVIDESNRPILTPHEMSSHETLPKNGDRHAVTMRDIREGKKPLRLNYL